MRTLKLGLLIGAILLLSACSEFIGQNDDGYGDSEAKTKGLGLFSRFSGQQAGESYTTSAPHNQVYLFGYDSSDFNPKYEASLYAQATYLKDHAGARILLTGHTDERGSREYNVALGERRANSVARLLRADGVAPRQIRVVSYGKERPVNPGYDEDARSQNRRVELIYEATR